jgi:tetratricopeptide (TPR) repeat protein
MLMLERLADLADQSLLESTADPTPRFRLLQTVREYALAHLAETGEGDTIRERHLHLSLALAEKAAPELTGPNQAAWLERLDRDVDNLRVALGWAREAGQTEPALRLAGALVRFWVSRGYWAEGREWLASLLAREDAAAVSAAVRALAFSSAGLLANVQGDLSQAVQWLEQGIALYHEAGDPIGAVRTVNTLAGVAFDQGDFAGAARGFEECVAQSRAANDAGEVARALGNLGEAYYYLDDLKRAAACYQEALAIARQAGRSDAEAFILGDLGNVAHQQGDLTRAAALHQAALRLKQTLGDRRQIAITLEDQAALAATEGRLESGARLLGAATKLRETIGSQRPASEERAVERTAARARTMLGEEAWAAEFAAGEALSLTAAIAYALEM